MKLSFEELQLLNSLEQLTGARANDVVCTPETMFFVVEAADVGKAIGRGGSNIARLRERLGKNVEVIAGSADYRQFFNSLFSPALVKDYVERGEGGAKRLDVVVDESQRGIAIGRNGEKIKKAKIFGKRYFGYDEVRVVLRA
ncbi:MAG: NusA-like transcription termination signal-binding factor [Candidatus Micrarchaeota archaeon]